MNNGSEDQVMNKEILRRSQTAFLHWLLAALFFLVGLLAACDSTPTDENSPVKRPLLRAYVYDSFVAEDGAGPLVEKAFEAKCGCDLELIAAGDAAALLSRILLEKEQLDKISADLVIGLDQQLASRALDSKLFVPYEPPNLEHVKKDLVFDPSHQMIPFEYGVFSFVYNEKSRPNFIQDPQARTLSLEDLVDKASKNFFLIQDPRTSTPGLGFLIQSILSLGKRKEKVRGFWESLSKKLLSITPGWSLSYSMFLENQAPLVWSYTSSPAFHKMNNDKKKIRALFLNQPHVMQIETVSILKSVQNKKLAQSFVDFLLSEKSQQWMAKKNIMFPARKDIQLPESFKGLSDVKKYPGKASMLPEDELNEWLEIWKKVF
jgi:thiamine transport system substrate-binding protein